MLAPALTRAVEPQHNGTPHWHMMLFIEPNQAESFQGIVEHYSFEQDGDEKGAAENRCDFKLIDPKKGSATGYIAKYVSKNIDGKDLDKGVYGEDPIMAAQRVEAWASCWGIRQFQQVGGASVTVWRELRRLRNVVHEDETLTELGNAADSGDWAIGRGIVSATNSACSPVLRFGSEQNHRPDQDQLV